MASCRAVGLVGAWWASVLTLAFAGCEAAPTAPAARTSDAASPEAISMEEVPAPAPPRPGLGHDAAPTWQQTPLEPLSSPAKLAPGKFNSARACGACHQGIFERWARSMHANSFVDPVFRSALYKAHYESQGAAAAICLRCHSPTVSVTKDIYGTSELSREGVSCDYCHSIGAVSADAHGTLQYALDFSRKHGPYEKTSSPAHAVGFRPFFEKSEICAGCHDMVTPDGTIVFSTYSEWKASKYGQEGRHCHECHMPRLSGPTVKGVEDASGHDVFNDHRLLGGHEPTQLKKAVTLTIESLGRDADRVRAVVALENSGAGHFVPTGIPSRKLVLRVTATQRGRTVFRREVVYQRVMQDEHDRTLTEDWEIKLKSKRVLRDNRLAPLETRRESFVFAASQLDDVEISARLDYVYEPGGAASFQMDVQIGQADRILARGL